MTATSDQLLACHRRGCQAWPELRLGFEGFQAQVARLEIPWQALELHAEDLFLTMAVLEGDQAALAIFDQTCLRPACSSAARIDKAPAFLDDVEQELRLKLLTGSEPKLRLYTGAGPLLPWLRVAALRTAIDLKRSERRAPVELRWPEPPRGGTNLELDATKGLYLDIFRRAVETSFGRLSPRDRTLMHLHFAQGVSVDAIAAMYGAHRSSVSRWLAAIRRSILDETRALLAKTNDVGSGSIRSLYRALEPELQLTLSRLLSSASPPPEPAAARAGSPGRDRRGT
jgi:RNA polymerase sigma-70 factor (ECF subfamily)